MVGYGEKGRIESCKVVSQKMTAPNVELPGQLVVKPRSFCGRRDRSLQYQVDRHWDDKRSRY